jgi:hypothetical protein
MKNNIFSGIEEEHLVKSAMYLGGAILLVILSFPVGVLKGSTMGVLLFAPGLMLFYYALLFPWSNAKYYFIGFAVLFLLYVLLWIFRATFLSLFELQGHWQEDIAWTVGGVCIGGFIVSIIGIYVFSDGLKCLLYSAATVALMAIFIMFPYSTHPEPLVKQSIVITEYFILGILFIVVALFFRLATIKQRKSFYSKMALLITGIILIFMAVWGFFVAKEIHWAAGIRAWAMLLGVAGIMSICAFAFFNEEEPRDVR